MDKRSLSERDICTKFITPALRGAGWDEMSQLREEVTFTAGRIVVRGKLVTRRKQKRADYILSVKPNIPVAVIEAKDNNHSVGDGMQQALDYAETLHIPFAFSSNGDGFVFHDRTGGSNPIETNLTLDGFPSPERSVGALPDLEGTDARSRGDGTTGLLRGRRRQDTALLPGQRRQRGRRGHRQGAEPHLAGHGHGHGQDVHRFPDHLAAVEGTT